MAFSHFFLAIIVVLTFVGIASADYRAGRSLKPYKPNEERYGRSTEEYYPEEKGPNYKDGHSLERYDQYQEKPANYKDGHSLERYDQYQEKPANYKDGHSLERYDQAQEKPAATKVQGLIYCRRNNKLIPMQGATARVKCMVKKENGYEAAPLSVETPVTDKKGYFLINLSRYTNPRYSLSNCRVFLDEPAHGDCNVETNTNNGIGGAPLTKSKSRRLPNSNSILYSVGPFVFAPSSY